MLYGPEIQYLKYSNVIVFEQHSLKLRLNLGQDFLYQNSVVLAWSRKDFIVMEAVLEI